MPKKLAKTITESNLESEEDNALIVSDVVLLGQNVLKLVLGDRSTLRMDHLNGLAPKLTPTSQTIWRRFNRGFLMNFLTRTVTAASDIVVVDIDSSLDKKGNTYSDYEMHDQWSSGFPWSLFLFVPFFLSETANRVLNKKEATISNQINPILHFLPIPPPPLRPAYRPPFPSIASSIHNRTHLHFPLQLATPGYRSTRTSSQS